jgi:secondary thiamine-phosphate synthase enzyme
MAKEATVTKSVVIQIETTARVEFKDITASLHKQITDSGVASGLLHLFVPHTTAAILVNENDDLSLARDVEEFLAKLAPRDREYHHNDGNCDAHLKASVIGGSKTLMIENGRLVLGTWQGVFFCEFDGPRRRSLRVKIVSD